MHAVDLHLKVRLACRDGMSERAAVQNFGIARESAKTSVSKTEFYARKRLPGPSQR